MDGNLTALQRFFLAFVAFFAVLLNRRFAEEVHLLRERQRAAQPPGTAPARAPAPEVTAPPPSPPPAPAAAPATLPAAASAPASTVARAAAPPAVAAAPATSPAGAGVPAPVPVAVPAPASEAAALHVLALLQRDGRLIDFVSEDLTGFSDSEIGAAARTVHAGCRKVLSSYLELEPVFREQEGARVTVAAGFDPAAVRLTGNVVGAPPFKGSLRHHGWRATRSSFPPLPPAHDPHLLAPAEVEL